MESISVIKKINEQFGAGAIMNFTSGSIVSIGAISTGSLALDKATGIGGIPIGRITEIGGMESSGKCLTKDTNILTPNGYKTIEEIFSENGLDCFCINKTIPITYTLINKDGQEEDTTHFTLNGRRPLYQIQTQAGREIKCSSQHPIKVLNEYGFIVWRFAQDIKLGDILVGRKGDKVSSQKELITEKEAYILGLLVADGHFNERRILFTNNDPFIKDFYTNNITTLYGLLGQTVLTYQKNNEDSVGIHINSKVGTQSFYTHYGIVPGVAKDKLVPKVVKNSNLTIQKAFIRGYLDCECSIGKNVLNIEVTSASLLLLQDVQLMLRNMGIFSTLTEKYVKSYPNNNYYRLALFSENVNIYRTEIGFDSPQRKKSLNNLLSKCKSKPSGIPNIGGLVNTYYDSLPFQTRTRSTMQLIADWRSKNINITHQILDKLLLLESENHELYTVLKIFTDRQLVFERVKSIYQVEGEPTFDFTLPKTHSFIAEGIITHNSSLCLHIVAEAQKSSERFAAYIDTEHAFDPKYAEKCGVDLERIYISQPDNGEQALEICEALIRSEECSVVIIDSVAALVPKAEIEAEMEDMQIGLQARLMSKAMRKLTGAIHKTETAMIFTNQIRQKIGVMFGSPNVSPGGMALKFYASMRLELKRIQSIKESGAIVGSVIRIKVIKNKVAPPFGEAELEIEHGEGFSVYGEVLDMAVEYGLIEKRAAYYYRNGERMGQGRVAIKKLFKDDPVLYEELRNQIIEKLNMCEVAEVEKSIPLIESEEE